jgi:VIT1/CCC1 family predicted Fe2+/Mn2+ transporter
MPVVKKELHRTGRIGWLRAAVLGANDGILSTSSLVLGVAAAHATRGDVLVAGVAGLVAGAMSMAAGEYVSVHSQADTEEAELQLERAELKEDDKGEHKELMAIYVTRGLEPSLAKQVAEQLMAHDALGAHARDELGISETFRARPIQAAFASAASFAAGAAMPILVTAMAPAARLMPLVSITSLMFLALLADIIHEGDFVSNFSVFLRS